MLIWYHGTSIVINESPLSVHTYKKVRTFYVRRQNDVIIADFTQIADLH